MAIWRDSFVARTSVLAFAAVHLGCGEEPPAAAHVGASRGGSSSSQGLLSGGGSPSDGVTGGDIDTTPSSGGTNDGSFGSGGVGTGGTAPIAPVATEGRIVDLRFEGDLMGEPGTAVHGEGVGSFHFESGFDGRALRLSADQPGHVGFGAPTALNLDEADDFSVQIWVKASSSGSAVLFSNADLSESPSPIHPDHGNVKLHEGWSLYLRDGSWGVNVGDGYKNFKYEPFPSTQVVSDGRWHHLVFSHDAEEDSMRVYFDGRKRAILNINNLTRGFASELDTNLGTDGRGEVSNSEPFDGWLDDAVIWNRVLSDDEVAGLYRSYSQVEYPIWTRKKPGKLVAIAWNIWHGGTHFTAESDGWDGAERTAAIIEELDPDFVMMQETYGAGGKIASILDYELMLAGSCWSATWGSNISVMSRYPMKRGFMTNELPEYNGGALIQLTDEQDILVFSNWYSRTRPQQVGQVLSGWSSLIENADSVPLLWGGDFNSSSHLDGDDGAHSSQMTDAGFIDSFRELNDPENRIDYLYYKGETLQATSSDMKRSSDFERYPSDHPIVYAEFEATFPLP